jgi:plasmid maintenance system killer protein
MISRFKHKGLELFFTKVSYKGVPAQHGSRIERMLDRLDTAREAKTWTCPVSNSMRSKATERANSQFQFPGTGESPLSLTVKMP